MNIMPFMHSTSYMSVLFPIPKTEEVGTMREVHQRTGQTIKHNAPEGISSAKAAERERLAKLTEEFLAKGGKITQVPPGYSNKMGNSQDYRESDISLWRKKK